MAVRIVDGRLEDLHVDRFAVRLAMFLDVLKDPPRRQDGRIIAAVLFGEMRREEVVVRLSAKLIPRQADLVLIILVGVNEPASEILSEDIERQALHQRTVAGLGMAQLVVGPFAAQCIADRVFEDPLLQIVLDEIVLRPADHRLGRHGLVRHIAKHDNRHFRRGLTDLRHRRRGVASGFRHVNQDRVDSAALETRQAV